MQIFEPYDNPFWDFNNDGKKKKNKFPLAPMGVLAPGSAQPPIDTIGNCLGQVSWRNRYLVNC